MYDLSREIVKPGCTLRELLANRIKSGAFTDDPEQYIARLQAALAEGEPTRQIVETGERAILMLNKPLPDGGWIVTHEEITDQHKAERQRAGMEEHR